MQQSPSKVKVGDIKLFFYSRRSSPNDFSNFMLFIKLFDTQHWIWRIWGIRSGYKLIDWTDLKFSFLLICTCINWIQLVSLSIEYIFRQVAIEFTLKFNIISREVNDVSNYPIGAKERYLKVIITTSYMTRFCNFFIFFFSLENVLS